MSARWAAVLLLAVAMQTAAADQRFVLVVSGLGGEPVYRERFQRWALSLVETMRDRYRIPAARVRWLAEPGVDSQLVDGVSDKTRVLAEIAGIAERSGPGDLVLVVLIGHGTALGERVLFNLPGPDLSPDEMAVALEALADRRLAVVNAAPASAAFLQRLSAPGRVVITATSTVAENQHTRFAGFFVEALAGDAADADKDGAVSLLEAFQYVGRRLEAAYRDEQRIQTEHPQLDDDGDGKGSGSPAADAADGAIAHRLVLSAGAGEDDTPEKLALDIQARALVDRVERLKREKPVMPAQRYREELERLLVELALNRRAYRAGSER